MHTVSETKDKVKSGFLLHVVVRQGAAMFKLRVNEDWSLLIGRNTLLILDLGLHVVDGVRRLDLKDDGLA